MTTASTDFSVYETDVLVIGGGLAALRAALSAREAGARVLVVVKRKPRPERIFGHHLRRIRCRLTGDRSVG